MVAHDNTVMNAPTPNATPSADDESTLSESTPIGTDPQRDVMSDVVPDVTPEEVPGVTIAYAGNGNSARRGDETIAIGDLPAHALE